MNIYFDNSATTKLDDNVMKCMNDFASDFYANPSSMHKFGFQVEEEIKKSAIVFSEILNVNPREILWTSGGTESNNLAIMGFAEAHKKIGNGIVTTKIEHPSVHRVCEKLSEMGFSITYLPVNSKGMISLEDLSRAINDKTILVSIMHTNNEIGSVQDVESIGRLIKEKNSATAFHVDFVQGFGKFKIDCKRMGIDFLSISAHKFHGPKGVGALYKNSSCRISPLFHGGGQQDNLRPGTLNSIGIVGSSLAAKIAYDNIETEKERLVRIRDYLIDELTKLNDKYGNIYVNTLKEDNFAPHIISVSFDGIKSEVMLHSLEERGIYVSAGSACSSHRHNISDTLLAIGLSKSRIDSTIRISLGKYNSKEEIDIFIKELDLILPVLNIKKYGK